MTSADRDLFSAKEYDFLSAGEILSDELWRAVRPLLRQPPRRHRDGRPRLDDRKVLTGILYVLKSGTSWQRVPRGFGCGAGMTCWRRLQDWRRSGVWDALEKVLRADPATAAGIDWSRARARRSRVGAAVAAAAAFFLLLSSRADAYRPFISTDADTAAYRTIELELGFFGIQRQDGSTHGQTPQTVINYGFRPGFEAVGQFYLDEPPDGGARVLDAELSVKNVLRQGVLQDKPGPSVAMESVLLLPGAAGEDQPRAGWEESAILSHKVGDFTFHWNASVGLDQTATLPLGACGLIAEHPLSVGVRAVGELAGEAVNTLTPDNSGLLGLIWSSGWRDADFDLGVRHGLSAAAPLWSVVAGISIPFAVDGRPDSNPKETP